MVLGFSVITYGLIQWPCCSVALGTMCEGGKLCELHRDFLNGEKVHIWGGGRGVALEMENDQTGLLHTAVADVA